MEKDLVLIEKKITENIQREKAHKLESLLCFEKMKSKVLVFEIKKKKKLKNYILSENIYLK